MPDPTGELRVLATWISRQSKNSLKSCRPELAGHGIQLDLVHFAADARGVRHLPIAVGKYLALLLRVLTHRYDLLLVNPADTWLRRPNALRGLLAIARIRRLPVAARWGNSDWMYRQMSTQLSRRRFDAIRRLMARTAVANLVLTRAQGIEVQGWVGFSEFDIIGNCMRVPDEWIHERRSPPSEGLVVNVASVQPRKGPDLFVRVAHQIVSTTHPKARFVWLGGIATPPITELIDELGVSASVEFRRRVFPPYPFLHSATVMLFPSRSEAFGLAVAEAMACGLPVCCFAGTGSAEVVADCGVAVQMESVDAMADAVRSYLDPTDVVAISDRSRTRFLEHFSPAPFASTLADVLRARLQTASGR